jgi:hypothetical protein
MSGQSVYRGRVNQGEVAPHRIVKETSCKVLQKDRR